ncbi:heavy metal-associated domain protein, partial [Ostertagia ostertagi]
MTCHACVNNIQDTMRTRPGIHSCKVSLDDAEGVVVFDPILWTGMSVAESIDDMGFEAKLKYTREGDEISVAANSAPRKAIISIKGMVCHACVNNIQDTTSKRDGVLSVVVSLEDEKGI